MSTIKVKKLYYFLDINDGTQRKISEKEYHRKVKEYHDLCWDYEEFSRNFLNTEAFVQYENCTQFYNNDFSVVIGYGQREIY